MNIVNMFTVERHHLEILSLVEETGTLAKAAKSLGLTQPALTHSIRKLESLLGLAIWEKKGRKIALTAAGELILESGRRILGRFQALEQDLQSLAATGSPLLRIGVECHPCHDWLLGRLERFLKENPGARVDLIRDFPFQAMEALIHHRIDVLITPDPHPLDSLQYIPLAEYELKLLTPIQHPLSQKGFVTPEDLRTQTIITFPVESERLDIFNQFLGPAGILPANHIRQESLEMMVILSASGRGLSVIPDWLVPPRQDLAALRMGTNGIQKTLYAGIRRKMRIGTHLQSLLNILQGNKSSS